MPVDARQITESAPAAATDALVNWVIGVAELTQPDAVYWCDGSEAERDRQALKASIYSFAIMVVAFYVGQMVMNLFGVSITGLRIAGGLIVAFIGFRMLFPEQKLDETPEVERRGEELRQRRTQDIAFIPLAMPTTAGPGTIAMIISVAAAMRDVQP